MISSYFVNRKKCPACNSDQFEKIYQNPYNEPPIREYLEAFYLPQGRIEFEYLEGATYFLAQCEVCGLIFQKEIPNDDLMERIYEYWIDPQKAFMQHQKQNGLDHYVYYAQEIMQIIAYLGKVPSSLSFFDFGMGWGRWALMAKAFGCNSYGSELSKERIEYAKSNGINVITWDQIPHGQFDFINTEQVFEHIPDPLQTLLHLKKSLKPNGLLKISAPTANDIERRLRVMDWNSPKGSRNSLNPVAPLEHINFFRRRSLIMMANSVGLEEVFIPLKRQYQFITGWTEMKRIAKNILRPLYRNILKRQNHVFFANGSRTGNR